MRWAAMRLLLSGMAGFLTSSCLGGTSIRGDWRLVYTSVVNLARH